MRKIKNLCLISIALAFFSPLSAQTTESVFSFLQLPVSPRSAVFSTHVVSMANPDIFSAIGNPAYIDSSFHNTAQIAYFSHFSDVNYSSAAYAYSLKSGLNLTGIIRYMNYGSFDRIDELGNELGNFSSYDAAFTFAVSKKWASNFSVAISATLIRSVIDNFNAHGLTFTLGSYYRIPEQLVSLGLVIRDVGVQLNSFNQQQESIPFDISLGATKQLKYVPFRFSLTAHSLQQWPLRSIYDSETPDLLTNISRHLSFGGELLFTEQFNLRFGLNKHRLDNIQTDSRIDFSGTAFGAGFKINRFLIDLSRTSFSQVGAHYQLSLLTHF